MKTITRNIFIAFCLTVSFFSSYAQTVEQRKNITKDYDKEALRNLQSKFAAEYKADYARALVLAKQNDWALKIAEPNGGSSVLHGVTPEGKPIYYTTYNVNSAITSRTNQVQPGGSLGLNLTGKDMFAGVWDIDYPIDHKDFTKRVYKFDGGVGTTAFHATHVVGTVISNGANNAAGKGMASEGWVWFSNADNDTAEMISAAESGMLVSNHSYGPKIDGPSSLPVEYFGAYLPTSKDLDQLTHDAPYYQPFYAAGNDRAKGVNPTKNGYDLLLTATVAKNVIAVAATYKVPQYTGPNSVVMSTFSSWGPTDDNRVKPDISNDGVNVLSTDNNPSLIGYNYSDGTSMATPGVVGAALLLQEYYGKQYAGEYMKSATLRALIFHTASEAGAYPGPDPQFGWGLMDTGKAAQVITDSKTEKATISELTLNNNKVYIKKVTATGSQPLVVTIDWTDLPGTVNTSVENLDTPVLVNNLDVRVTKDSEVYYPWKLGPNYTDPAVKGDNNVDNVEKVEIENPSGTYTITVTHKGTLTGGSQDFSLIVTGEGTLDVKETVFKEFNIWPNPIQDQLNISIQSQLSDDVYVTVYDILGKRLIDEKLDFSNDLFKGKINVDFLNKGVYLVKVTQGNSQTVRKIIKK